MEQDMSEFLRDHQAGAGSYARGAASSLEYKLGRALLKEIKRLAGRERKRGFSKERIKAAAKVLLKRPKKRDIWHGRLDRPRDFEVGIDDRTR